MVHCPAEGRENQYAAHSRSNVEDCALHASDISGCDSDRAVAALKHLLSNTLFRQYPLFAEVCD